MVSGASSPENITIGRGSSRLIITTCSSTSRPGESVSMMMTSGCSSSTARGNSMVAASAAATSWPARSSPSRSTAVRSGDSSTISTRMVIELQ